MSYPLGAVMVFPAWLADTLSGFVSVGVFVTYHTVAGSWAIAEDAGFIGVIATGEVTVLLLVGSARESLPSVVTHASSIVTMVDFVRVLYAVYTICVFITILPIASVAVAAGTFIVTVTLVELAVGSSPAFFAFTGSAIVLCEPCALVTVAVAWATAAVAACVALTDVLVALVASPVGVTCADTVFVPVGVSTAGLTLFGEVSTWA